MDVASRLLELYSRIPPPADKAVDGVDLATLAESPTTACSILGRPPACVVFS
jgi:hypothetical protein